MKTTLIRISLSAALNVGAFTIGGGNSLASSTPIELRLVEGHQSVCTASSNINQGTREIKSHKSKTTLTVNFDHFVIDGYLREYTRGIKSSETFMNLKIHLSNGVPDSIGEVSNFSINGDDYSSHPDIKKSLSVMLYGFILNGQSLTEGKVISQKKYMNDLFAKFKVEELKIKNWDITVEEINFKKQNIILNQKYEMALPDGGVLVYRGPWQFDLKSGLTTSSSGVIDIRYPGVNLTGDTTQNCQISELPGYQKSFTRTSNRKMNERISKEIRTEIISTPQTEEKLIEVKSLLEKGLISEKEATEKRRSILGLQN